MWELWDIIKWDFCCCVVDNKFIGGIILTAEKTVEFLAFIS